MKNLVILKLNLKDLTVFSHILELFSLRWCHTWQNDISTEVSDKSRNVFRLFFFKDFLFNYICMWVYACEYRCLSPKVLDHSELVLQAVVSCPTSVLGTKPASSLRAEGTLPCSSISPTPFFFTTFLLCMLAHMWTMCCRQTKARGNLWESVLSCIVVDPRGQPGHFLCGPHFVYPFIRWYTSLLIPFPSYYELGHSEH